MEQPILSGIREFLTREKAVFREVHHEPTLTSEESARARGEGMHLGGKALLLKTDDVFRIFVLPGDHKLDSGAIRQQLSLSKTRFATPEELKELTGLVPGCVPPFGEPILPFPLFVDEMILKNEKIAFNAGSLTDSIILQMDDWVRIAKPQVLRFALPKDQ